MRRVSNAGLLAVMALGLVSGCADKPSFTVAWAFAPTLDTLDDAKTLDSEVDCALRGVDGIRVTTFLASTGIQVDERSFECAEGPVDGPELETGEYRVEIAGIRRAGEEWSCDETAVPLDICSLQATCFDGAQWCTCEDQDDCAPGLTCVTRSDIAETCTGEPADARTCVACPMRTATTITVETGADPLSVTADLLEPPQCDDGIDNDGDGFTDALNPACNRNPLAVEDADASDAVFALGVSFFDNSPVVDCFETRVAGIQMDLLQDGVLLDSTPLPCTRSIPPFARALDEGDYSISVTAVDFESAPLTASKTVDLIRVTSTGAFVGASFDYDDDDFLTPLTGPAAFFPSYAFLPDGPPRTSCLTSSGSFSKLAIEQLRVELFDEDGVPIDPSTSNIVGGVDQGDGSVILDCPSAGVLSDSLTWNKYTASVEAMVGGEVCFTTDEAQPLSPRTPQTLVLDRVLVDGAPTGACRDCTIDDDCTTGAVCKVGVCQASTGDQP